MSISLGLFCDLLELISHHQLAMYSVFALRLFACVVCVAMVLIDPLASMGVLSASPDLDSEINYIEIFTHTFDICVL